MRQGSTAPRSGSARCGKAVVATQVPVASNAADSVRTASPQAVSSWVSRPLRLPSTGGEPWRWIERRSSATRKNASSAHLREFLATID